MQVCEAFYGPSAASVESTATTYPVYASLMGGGLLPPGAVSEAVHKVRRG